METLDILPRIVLGLAIVWMVITGTAAIMVFLAAGKMADLFREWHDDWVSLAAMDLDEEERQDKARSKAKEVEQDARTQPPKTAREIAKERLGRTVAQEEEPVTAHAGGNNGKRGKMAPWKDV